jgi:hypothetical protein
MVGVFSGILVHYYYRYRCQYQNDADQGFQVQVFVQERHSKNYCCHRLERSQD